MISGRASLCNTSIFRTPNDSCFQIEKEVEDFEALLQRIGFLRNDSLSRLRRIESDVDLAQLLGILSRN